MLVRAERHRWIDGSMAQPLAVFFIFSKVQESGYSWATRISRFWVIRSGQCTSGPLFDARHTQKKCKRRGNHFFFFGLQWTRCRWRESVAKSTNFQLDPVIVLRWVRSEMQSDDIFQLKFVAPMKRQLWIAVDSHAKHVARNVQFDGIGAELNEFCLRFPRRRLISPKMDWQKAVKWQRTCFSGSEEKRKAQGLRVAGLIAPQLLGRGRSAESNRSIWLREWCAFFGSLLLGSGIELWP